MSEFDLKLLVELYKARIDKAIEYIEYQKKFPEYDNNKRCNELLEILKGEENGNSSNSN